jgi:hypothetical protein
MNDPQIIVREHMSTRRLPCRLTEAQLDEKVRTLARVTRDEQQREGAVATASDALKTAKEELKAVQGERHRLADCITTGREERQVECDEVHDYRVSRVYTRRSDTGAIVGVRDMTDQELQMTILPDGTAMSAEDLEEAVRLFFSSHPDLKSGEGEGTAPDEGADEEDVDA